MHVCLHVEGTTPQCVNLHLISPAFLPIRWMSFSAQLAKEKGGVRLESHAL